MHFRHLLFAIVSVFFLFPFVTSSVYATSSYVTVVNPIRGRSQIGDSKNIDQFIQMVGEENIPTTFLIQYDNLSDEQVVDKLKNLSQDQEVGLFLEVSESWANDSRVAYLFGDGDYYRADKVLLSGYDPEDRKRLIDQVFNEYKKKFGFTPKSVGAWYIDAFSLLYMRQRYNVTSALVVSDQFKTDGYGLWGQPWGNAYVPSLLNPLEPSNDASLKLSLIQWAQRDPVRGYGTGVSDSTFSMQANDYIAHHNLDTSYFLSLAKVYLESPNMISQLTLGLEIGQEGTTYLKELKKQISMIKNTKFTTNPQFVTMSQFADIFISKGPLAPITLIGGKDYSDETKSSWWITTPSYRLGIYQDGKKVIIRDLRRYTQLPNQDLVAKDSVFPLSRVISSCIDSFLQKNELIISENAQGLNVDKVGNTVTLTIKEPQGIKQIKAGDSFINIDGKRIFDKKIEFRERILKFLSILFVQTHLEKPQLFEGGLRFSQIEGRGVFGFMIEPDTLVGFTTQRPFFGVFHFPFQVLTRFKTIPHFSLVRFILSKFINTPIPCTMQV